VEDWERHARVLLSKNAWYCLGMVLANALWKNKKKKKETLVGHISEPMGGSRESQAEVDGDLSVNKGGPAERRRRGLN
jgi:hypothetical protein